MLKFTSIVGYTSCGPTYIESFLTIFGQCINVLNYKSCCHDLGPELALSFPYCLETKVTNATKYELKIQSNDYTTQNPTRMSILVTLKLM